MAVRSRRLGHTSVATVGAGATTTIFTVPANRTAIVKDLHIAVTAATTPPVALTVSVLLASSASRRLWADAVNVGTREPWAQSEPWIVLEEGDSLQIAQPAACTVQTYCSGALLDGDPS